MSVKLVAVTQRGEKMIWRGWRRSLMAVPRALPSRTGCARRAFARHAVMRWRACKSSASLLPEAFHDRIGDVCLLGEDARSSRFVEVSPVVGLTLTRAMEVKGTRQRGLSEAGRWRLGRPRRSWTGRLCRRLRHRASRTLRSGIVGPESGLKSRGSARPVVEGSVGRRGMPTARPDATGRGGTRASRDCGRDSKATQPLRARPGKRYGFGGP